ncbi:3-dehydroquinate synthase [Butyrivibrio sp. MC2013]|uniref:3-dehydroquinate synthase n=1 Tax=Butyrivibrio sp. MC2013 TaxID=1280686 RepID=UPI0003F8B55A|nr:3-dehydroquinate synthase [Butyrivibrio sp. MC2013]
MDRLSVKYQNQKAYDIVIDSSYSGLASEVDKLGFAGRRAAIITDSNVGPLYAELVSQQLCKVCSEVYVFTIPAGEENKNLTTVQNIYEFLVAKHFDRHDMLAALGGGVTGDITGFAASTYLRGIAFIQLPTSLLAQTDSSVGGKTGVDLDGYKNMVGAFYMPRLVYTNVTTLDSLNGRLLSEGMGEVLKHGLIKDQSYYFWMIENFNEIITRDHEILEKMIKRSCEIKRDVVEHDPHEKGERALLNFGHTIGHAIEKAKNFTLLHGECVALGCIAAAYISMKKGLIDTGTCYEIRDMFVPFGLPISVEDVNPDEIADLVKSDKKMDNGHIRFILLHDIGDAFISTDVTDEEIREAVKEILFVDGE